MTDLVAQLVGALGKFVERFKDHEDAGPRGETWQSDEFLADLAEARAALSAAKDGGWVAVPVEPTPEMKAEGIKVEVYSEASDSIGALTWAEVAAIYRAMLAARPLPAPPAQKEPT